MSTLNKIYQHCAGIDIGSQKVFVSIEQEPVRSFLTFTASYRDLGAYLKEHHITHVAMEATGIYWITLFDILESLGFDVTLVNPADRCSRLPMDTTIIQLWVTTEKFCSRRISKKTEGIHTNARR